MFVVLTACAAHVGFLTNDRYARTVGFGNFFTRQVLEIPTDRPTKVCEKNCSIGNFLPDRSSKYEQTDQRKSAKKLLDFWKSLHVQVELYFSGIFERHGLVSFVEQRDNFSQKPCERSGSWREHGRNGKDLFKLDRAASFGRKGHVRRTYSVPVCGFFDKQSIRGRLDFETCFTRQLLEKTDRLTQESLRPKLSAFRKSLHVQRKVVVWWGFWEAGFGLLSGAPWFRRSGERGFDQRRMIRGPRLGQRHVGGRRRTRPIKC